MIVAVPPQNPAASQLVGKAYKDLSARKQPVFSEETNRPLTFAFGVSLWFPGRIHTRVALGRTR
eukprot:COSAG06_NODE_6751_length_2798_cov_4.781030_1_plen_63_part_10